MMRWDAILTAEAAARGQVLRSGCLDLIDGNYGFLRGESFLAGPDDVYVSHALVRRHGLRPGGFIIGPIRTPRPSVTIPRPDVIRP